MKPQTALDLIIQIRHWLNLGATIKATDKDGRILEEGEDGSVFAGITVEISQKCQKCRGVGSVLPKNIWDPQLVSCPDCEGLGYTFTKPTDKP